jgi:NADP-dependent 3-hydroxy acid dehydrogenase YdfG
MAKTVLITGASSGFGEACAEKFADAGYSLVLTARRADKLEQLKQRLESKCAVYIAPVDITDHVAVEDVLAKIPTEFQAIDILVNNAGLALGLDSADKAEFSDWETMIDTNILGLLRMTRYYLPSMVKRNTGHIINIGSTAGSWPYPGGNVYGATKAFVQNFSRNLRADLLGKNIRVTNIEPGMAETDFSNIRFKGDGDKAQEVYANAKALSAADVADIIFWVTSVPAHVNINSVEVMALCQAWGRLAVDRTMLEQ